MDILEEYSDSEDTCSLCSMDRCAEEMKTDEGKEIVRYFERDASVRILIEHPPNDTHVSSTEMLQEFIRPINDNEDIEVLLASLRFKLSYMRKFQSEYIPCNLFVQDSRKESECDSMIRKCLQNPVTNPHRLPVPIYLSSLFYRNLARPLICVEFMKLIFSSLSRLFENSQTDMYRILGMCGISASYLNSFRKDSELPAHLEDRFLLRVNEVKTVENCLLDDFEEFYENCGRCESHRRHLVDGILADLPFGFESFKRELMVCDHLEHLLGNSEFLANRIISFLYEYSAKVHELSLYSKRTAFSQDDD